MTYRLNTKKPNLISLILLISFPSFAAVLLSPALPALGAFYAVSASYAQQSITLFILGYAFGQLLYSPFSERFGRKIAVYWGLGIYFIGCFLSLGSVYLCSMHLLLIGRLVMGLGSASGMVLTYTFINDFYYPHQARPVVSYTILSYAFMPSLAVLIGGFLTSKISWIACLYFLLLYGLVILMGTWQLPETLLEKDPKALNFKQMISSYLGAFKNLRLILFSTAFGLVITTIYTTASGAPFIAIKRIGVSAALYGLLMLIPYCCQLLGALLSGRLNQRISAYRMLFFSYSITSLGALFFLISFLLNWINLWSLLVSIALVMFGIPSLTSNASVMAITEYPDKSAGSGVMSFIVMSMSLIAVLTYSIFPADYKLLLPLFYVVSIGLSFLCYLFAKNLYQETPNS